MTQPNNPWPDATGQPAYEPVPPTTPYPPYQQPYQQQPYPGQAPYPQVYGVPPAAPYGQPPYGYPMTPGYGAMAPSNGLALAAMVTALVGIAFAFAFPVG